MNYFYPQILCVDSDTDFCNVLDLILKAANDKHEMTSSHSTEDALYLIKQRSFDLFIIALPVTAQTDFDLCRVIRSMNATVPIIIFSPTLLRNGRDKALAAGADEYLTMPADISRFPGTVEKLLQRDFALKKKPE